jgi:hypothetical protein
MSPTVTGYVHGAVALAVALPLRSVLMNTATQPLQSTVRYRWIEGPAGLHPRAAALASQRPLLRERFYTAVLPDLAHRGVARQVRGIGVRGGSSRAIWSSWKVPGEERVLWALQVSTRQVRGATGGHGPANDGYVLAAWGDGPVIAWANDLPAVRAVLREALATLPSWLSAGVVSADATLPLRIVALTGDAGRAAWSDRGCAS